MSSLRRQHGRKSLPCCQLRAAIRLNLGVRPHMEIVASLGFVIAAVHTAIYLHALAKRHRIHRTERPELVEQRGSLDLKSNRLNSSHEHDARMPTSACKQHE